MEEANQRNSDDSTSTPLFLELTPVFSTQLNIKDVSRSEGQSWQDGDEYFLQR